MGNIFPNFKFLETKFKEKNQIIVYHWGKHVFNILMIIKYFWKFNRLINMKLRKIFLIFIFFLFL